MGRTNTGRVICSLLLAATLAGADTLMLRNGSRYEGNYLGGDGRTIRFAVSDRVTTYNLTDIESIRFSGAASDRGDSNYAPAPYPSANAAPAPAPNANQTYGNQTYNQRPYNSGSANPESTAPQPYGNAILQVPAGTEVTVRLIDPVDLQTDRLGQTYRASLDQPVVVNGQTVIPRGADAVATLIDAQKSGKIEGRTSLTLDLKNVTVNGRQYDITTTGVSQESNSRGARSAKVIGGTAAVGAIIGAIAGGGKGAAIGAGSGAAVGTAAQVMTSGQRVKVPAETRLSFTLQNAINI